MSDKSFGDHLNKNIVKNPLLSTAVTGLSIEDLTHNAVLLPAAPSQVLATRLVMEHAAFSGLLKDEVSYELNLRGVEHERGATAETLAALLEKAEPAAAEIRGQMWRTAVSTAMMQIS